MLRLRRIRRAIAAAFLISSCALPAAGQVRLADTEYDGTAALGLALRQLGTTKRVLMIAAHPDDEQTQLLSALALGQGAEVAYLSLTRGEGGQNGIGPELQEALGLLRSEELLAARRLDGTRQFFTRAIDWGFSKSAEEAFRMWPQEELLRDVVAVVRHFRPDVIVSVFTGTPRDGHGQHQVAGMITALAFDASADPGRFPDQIAAGLRPHSPVHLFQLVRGGDEAPAARISTGDLDPLIGRSHFQVAMASRSRHRSQDMGRLQTPGPQSTALTLGASRSPPPAEGSIFAGVDTSIVGAAATALGIRRAAGADPITDLLMRYEATLDDLRRSFNPFFPDRIVPFLTESARMLDQALAMTEARTGAGLELAFQLGVQRERLSGALLRAGRVTVDAIASDETIVPGQTFELDLHVWNGGGQGIDLDILEPRLPAGWIVSPSPSDPQRIEPGAIVRRRFEVTVPADADPTEPYFLRLPREGSRYAWPAEVGPVGVPFQPDEVAARAVIRIRDVEVRTEVAASFQGLDPRSGEFRRPVRVVPAVAVAVEPGLVVLPIGRAAEPLRFSVRLDAQEPHGLAGTLHIDAPEGWRIEPAAVPVRFEGQGEERVIDFIAHAPADPSPGRVSFAVQLRDERGRRFDRGYALVDYPHIRPRPLYRDATIDVQIVDVQLPGSLRVGYVGAAGDNVPLALGQLGISLEVLGPAELAAAPLSGYDVIVVGIRAYQGRPDLVTHNQRLLDYVHAGGTMVVQYNQYEYTAPGIAPYPVEMARPHDRVTDAEAEVRFLEPDHPLLTTPNRLDSSDFEGWVQERGLYFLNRWDDRFTPLLEMADPGEAPNRGSLLVARHGEGTYVYTGLALFRQLPAGVPGAYRLFANLLAPGAQ